MEGHRDGPVAKWSNWRFRRMVLVFKVVDLFSGVEKRTARLPLKPGLTVVDYACGPGRYTLDIARRVGPSGTVYAVDIQPLAVSMVRDKAKKAGLTNVKPILVDSYNTGLPDGCADLVILLDAFYDMGDRNAVLREVRRLSKTDGTLILEPGNMDHDFARYTVTASGLFRFREKRSKDQWYSPVNWHRHSVRPPQP